MSSIFISRNGFLCRNTTPDDFAGIRDVCRRVYPFVAPYNTDQLESHHAVFPEGQLVVIEEATKKVVGMAASLVVRWDDYEMADSWSELTDRGYFSNHDPESGRTLYGAEVMVDPAFQGKGLGKLLYEARRETCRQLGLLRIRAGARLRGYGTYAGELSPEVYVHRVVQRRIFDPTLSFQVKQGFRVVGLTSDYLKNDPESLGYAAVIEWLNPEKAEPGHIEAQERFYQRLQKADGEFSS